jgi:hypothetical protein
MRVSFESSHVRGNFGDGRLTVRIQRVDDRRRRTRNDEISFEAPPDFHTHNDSVAAALLTLVGRSCPVVTFNFPISTRCAEILAAHYNLTEVGPIDPSLEPRRRGRYLGLMLSGGLDSMALWLTLRRVLGDDFKIITTDFGGNFEFESRGFQYFRRDVSCRTDFREKGFAREGRFTTAVPLLFADYADLASVTTGHHYPHVPLSVESLRDGGRPRFLDEDRPLNAGGLDEVHIMRCLNVAGQSRLTMLADDDMLEAAWHGSSPAGTTKRFHKGLILRRLYERKGLTPPEWIGDISYTRRRSPFAAPLMRFSQLYVIKFFGLEVAAQEIDDLERYDFSLLDALTLDCLERYNTNLIQQIPASMRAGVLAVFNEAGIEPYAERDWSELAELVAFCFDAWEWRQQRPS